MPTAIEFDFAEKIDREIPVETVKASVGAGRFVWLDLDASDAAAAKETLLRATPLEETLIDSCLALTPETKYDLRPSCLHLVMVSCHLSEASVLEQDRVDVLMGEGFCVTIHRDRIPFLEQVKKHYHDDFVRFAKTPGFLLYEMWDALIDGFEDIEHSFETAVEKMQRRILTTLDDQVFAEFGQLGSDLLHFRKILAPTRNVLDELATRKSRFVSEGTQPFLGGMVPRVERILQDVTVNREILSESLNLHMAINDHKLNKVMQKLTVVSSVFLPLTFLCGVYGMNFEHQPEFKWETGYIFFWVVAFSVATLVLYLMRRVKLL
jgi:magnesium transporter